MVQHSAILKLRFIVYCLLSTVQFLLFARTFVVCGYAGVQFFTFVLVLYGAACVFAILSFLRTFRVLFLRYYVRL